MLPEPHPLAAMSAVFPDQQEEKFNEHSQSNCIGDLVRRAVDGGHVVVVLSGPGNGAHCDPLRHRRRAGRALVFPVRLAPPLQGVGRRQGWTPPSGNVMTEQEARRMNYERMMSAAVVALIWAASVLWWLHLYWSNPNPGLAGVAILSSIGALFALLWCFGWLKRTDS